MLINMRTSLIIAAFVFSVQCTASDTKKSSCDDWLKQSVTNIEAIPANKRFNQSLTKISKACDDIIPDKLKQAAAGALKAKNENERFSVLMKASADYYRSTCFDIKPGKPAEYLFDFCFGDDYPDGPNTGMLSSLDASAYLYGRAVEKELKTANVNEFYTKKFMLNYFLGASLYYEEHKMNYKK